MTRKQVAEKLSAYYSKKFSGFCWATYDASKRKYRVQGEMLPPHPDMITNYPNGWSLLVYFKPDRARRIIAECGQSGRYAGEDNC